LAALSPGRPPFLLRWNDTPTTAIDDVFIDGLSITAENFDSARRFGQVIAQRLRP
jgi:hypothetical protein